ncbi:MAG: AI-2E family transporter [Planctomycetaceae bacterium]
MKATDSQLQRSFFVIATFCLIVLIIVVGRPVLAPLALSCILTFVLTPVVRYLESRDVSRGIAVGMTTTLTVLVAIALSIAFVSQLGHLVAEMPAHEREVAAKFAGLRDLGGAVPDKVWDYVDAFFAGGAGQAEDLEGEGVGELKADGVAPIVVVQEDSSPRWLEWLPSMIGPITEPIVNATVVVVLAVFMMLRRDDLRNRLLAFLGRTRMSRVTELLGDSSERLGRYLLGLLGVNFGFAVAFAMGLYFLGVPYPALWGCVTFFFRFVPFLGSSVSMLMPLAMALTVPGWMAVFGVIALYATLEFSSGNFLEPWLFGKSVGMNPLAVIIALMFWTWAWGMVGLLLATPLSLILVTLGRHFPCFESLNLLLGDKHPLPRHIAFYQRMLAEDDVELQSLLTATQRLRGPAFTVQRLLLDTLSHADRELRRGAITKEIHRHVTARVEALTAQVIANKAKVAAQDAPAEVNGAKDTPLASSAGDKLRIATFSLGDQRGSIVLQVLFSHRPELEVVFNQALVTPYMIRKCIDADVDLVVFSITGSDAKQVLESACRAFRRNGYNGWIAVGWWRSRRLAESTKRALKQAGADYVTYRSHSMNRMLDFTLDSRDQAKQPSEATESPPPDAVELSPVQPIVG